MIEFFAAGVPKTSGSKRAFFRPGMKHPAITEDCEKSGPWRSDVRDAAQAVYSGPPLTGALMLVVEFLMTRPKGHYRTGKNAGKLRDDAPRYHTSKPDATKLLRCLEDGLTGLLYQDDAQIAIQRVDKLYADAGPGARVKLVPLPVALDIRTMPAPTLISAGLRQCDGSGRVDDFEAGVIQCPNCQPCGHPRIAIRGDEREGTYHCGMCSEAINAKAGAT